MALFFQIRGIGRQSVVPIVQLGVVRWFLLAGIKGRLRFGKTSAHLLRISVVEVPPREVLTLFLCLNIVQATL